MYRLFRDRPLVSNPCLELWFLLHYKNQTANTTGVNCCREMANRNRTYEKGLIDDRLKVKLISKIDIAINRAKGLTEHNNPSSTVYKLIEILEELKR